MQLVFSRHGESEANVQGVFWNQPGRFPLTPKGRQQAEALADALADWAFAALYCSPVQRAVETAEIVGRRFRLTPQVGDGLREFHVGILEGKRTSKEREALYWQVVQQWMQEDNQDAQIPGGESFRDVETRFMPLIARLEAQYRDTDASVLLISHGGILRAMLPLLCANLDKAFTITRPVPYADPIVAELRDDAWVCVRWGKDNLL